MPAHIAFDRYHRYEELVAILQALHAAYPALTRLYSIGQSYEGRELWLMEITGAATGPAAEKPGYYLDANIHAGEVTGAAAALYTIHYLLHHYGTDERVTRLVDRQVFYILPRVSPDGAEAYLTRPVHANQIRSSVRPYRWPDWQEPEGILPEDLDGDGQILMMRIPDPDGEWRVSDRDPRLLVPRRPDQEGGRYFRLTVEGRSHDWDGVTIRGATAETRRLDLNRNFPVEWEPEARQEGAGPYPLSEPETRAVAEFILAHPNIVAAQSYHTFTGIILRPAALKPDGDLDPEDVHALTEIGRLGEEATGYPCVSIYHGFAYDPDHPIAGGFLDWAFLHRGILCYSTELWDLRARAGCDRVPFPSHGRLDPEEDGLKILRWIDQQLGGEGFYPWRPFAHPQFGAVELGGWDSRFLIQNCPPRLLQAEAHKNCLFTLRHAAVSPCLTLDPPAVTELATGLYRITAVVRNRGYLPTSGSRQAAKVKAVPPDRVELTLPAGAELKLGRWREEIGHLDGRVLTRPRIFPGHTGGVRERRLEWVLRAPPGSVVQVTARSERAGVARAEVRLGGAQG